MKNLNTLTKSESNVTNSNATPDVRKHNQILQKINILKKHTQTLEKNKHT